LRLFLSAFLWVSNPHDPTASPLRFQLRHEYAVANRDESKSVFSDVSTSFIGEYYEVSTKTVETHRPPSALTYEASLVSLRHAQSPLTWDSARVLGPNFSKRDNLLQLAKMTSNSYYGEPGHKSWYALNGWNASIPLGWEPDADSLRGYVFVSDDNSTVIISVKGGSPPLIGEGPTGVKDKLNDNLLFSCCCARVGAMWSTVCDCFAGNNSCDRNCVERSLMDDDLYYSVGKDLYNDVAHMYPNASIWLTGHSLGGAVASLLGVTFGVPAVAFESPGDKMAATRLHLPLHLSTQHITHVYHTADPMAMGTCTGVMSLCSIAGFALESRCHIGQRILYNTVSKRGWGVDPRKHGIQFIIDNLLNEDWDPENGEEVPAPDEETDCVDCVNWQYK
ncbi:Alpha/Beta hydrolase protein, partial [Mycena galericulata]